MAGCYDHSSICVGAWNSVSEEALIREAVHEGSVITGVHQGGIHDRYWFRSYWLPLHYSLNHLISGNEETFSIFKISIVFICRELVYAIDTAQVPEAQCFHALPPQQE